MSREIIEYYIEYGGQGIFTLTSHIVPTVIIWLLQPKKCSMQFRFIYLHQRLLMLFRSSNILEISLFRQATNEESEVEAY